MTSFLQNRVEEQVRESPLDPAGVDVEIDSFPLVTSVLLGGRVDRVSLTLTDFDRNGIHFDRLRLTLTGVKVNRLAVIRGEPGARSIRRGTLTARVAAEGPLAAAAEAGEVEAGGVVEGLLPCDASVRSAGSDLHLSCSLRPVPRDLLEEFGILG
ncbi:MAG: LmeA family phospholipid-binding protein [Actinomycetota bacterium]